MATRTRQLGPIALATLAMLAGCTRAGLRRPAPIDATPVERDQGAPDVRQSADQRADLAPILSPDLQPDGPQPADLRTDKTPDGWLPVNGLLAEWHANGDTSNSAAGSPWVAQVRGQVPYVKSAHGQAWAFRSMATSAVGDANYIEVPTTSGPALHDFAFDVWVRQTHFNSYPASNRMVVTTSWTEDFPSPGAGRAQVYLHENKGYYLYVKVGAGTVRGTDWDTCTLANPGTVALDSWVRFTATYDGVTLRCYRDGKETGSTPLASLNVATSGPLVIGRNYPGDIDALRIYDHARSASQIAAPWP